MAASPAVLPVKSSVTVTPAATDWSGPALAIGPVAAGANSMSNNVE